MTFNVENVNVTFLADTSERLENVDDKDYFGEMFEDYVSNSSLKHINPDEGGSPYKFTHKEKDESPALELGSAIHKMLLEGDKYFMAEMEKPAGKVAPVMEATYRLKQDTINGECTMLEIVALACKECDYYKDSLTSTRVKAMWEKGVDYYNYLVNSRKGDGLIILSPSLRMRLDRAVESVQANKQMMSILKPQPDIWDVRFFAEDVITMNYTACIDHDCISKEVKMKSKIDNWSIDFDNKTITLNDLKTTSSPIQYFMGRHGTILEPDEKGKLIRRQTFVPGSFQKYHYHRQMAMYKSMLYWYCAKEFSIDHTWTFNVNMLVVETVAPFNTHIYAVSDDWIEEGLKELTLLLTRVAWHTANGWVKLIEFI